MSDEKRNIGREIVEGLAELRDAVRNKVPLSKKFAVRDVELDLRMEERTMLMQFTCKSHEGGPKLRMTIDPETITAIREIPYGEHYTVSFGGTNIVACVAPSYDQAVALWVRATGAALMCNDGKEQ
jgi:hypothetical protein